MANILDLPPEILFEIFTYILVSTECPTSDHHPRNHSHQPRPPIRYKIAPKSKIVPDLIITNPRYLHPLISLTTLSRYLSSAIASFATHLLTTGRYGHLKRPPSAKTPPLLSLLRQLWTHCAFCNKSTKRDPILPLYARHFRLCKACDRTLFPKITFTAALSKHKLSPQELNDRRNGLVWGKAYTAGVMATLYETGPLERYVERREAMRKSIGWKSRGKMRSKLKVWEWEMGVKVGEGEDERGPEVVVLSDDDKVWEEGGEEMQAGGHVEEEDEAEIEEEDE